MLDKAVSFPDLETFKEVLNENNNVRNYWVAAKGWAESQLTPDQQRRLYRDREDEDAANRLRAYFFTDGLWDELSERAQQALAGADRALVSATHSRHALIVNELRIAVEETFHDSLWTPLSEWAATQRPPDAGLRAVLDRPAQQHRAPGLDDSRHPSVSGKPGLTSQSLVIPAQAGI